MARKFGKHKTMGKKINYYIIDLFIYFLKWLLS